MFHIFLPIISSEKKQTLKNTLADIYIKKVWSKQIHLGRMAMPLMLFHVIIIRLAVFLKPHILLLLLVFSFFAFLWGRIICTITLQVILKSKVCRTSYSFCSKGVNICRSVHASIQGHVYYFCP